MLTSTSNNTNVFLGDNHFRIPTSYMDYMFLVCPGQIALPNFPPILIYFCE